MLTGGKSKENAFGSSFRYSFYMKEIRASVREFPLSGQSATPLKKKRKCCDTLLHTVLKGHFYERSAKRGAKFLNNGQT